MAFIFRIGRMVPLAVRLFLTGGVAYGTVSAGLWSDSAKSQEALRTLKGSWREIEYPAVAIHPRPPDNVSVRICTRSVLHRLCVDMSVYLDM